MSELATYWIQIALIVVLWISITYTSEKQPTVIHFLFCIALAVFAVKGAQGLITGPNLIQQFHDEPLRPIGSLAGIVGSIGILTYAAWKFFFSKK